MLSRRRNGSLVTRQMLPRTTLALLSCRAARLTACQYRRLTDAALSRAETRYQFKCSSWAKCWCIRLADAGDFQCFLATRRRKDWNCEGRLAVCAPLSLKREIQFRPSTNINYFWPPWAKEQGVNTARGYYGLINLLICRQLGAGVW